MKRIALAVPVLLLAAACGGGSDDKDKSSSKAEYVSKAEAICKKANADQAALAFPTTAAAFPGYVKSIVDLAEKATEDIEALEPPAADKADLEAKVLKPLNTALEAGKKYQADVAAAAAKNDQTKLGQLVASPPTGSTADIAWMKAYGFVECVKAAES
jgi:hypothetical protein